MLIDQISNLSSVYHKTADEWRETQSKYDKRLLAASQPAAAQEEEKKVDPETATEKR